MLIHILPDDIWLYAIHLFTRSIEAAGNTETTTGVGAAYGTAKSGIGIAGVGTYRPDLIMKVCNSQTRTPQI